VNSLLVVTVEFTVIQMNLVEYLVFTLQVYNPKIMLIGDCFVLSVGITSSLLKHKFPPVRLFSLITLMI